MAFTCQDVCNLSRDWLNDDDKVRTSDAQLERFANACLQAMAILRPDLFTTFGAITPTVDVSWQDLAIGDSNILELYNILGNVNGAPIFETELRPLLAQNPAAYTEAAAAPVNWCRNPADKSAQSATRYFLFPRPITGTQILVQYAKSPTYVVLAATMPLSEAYRPAIANYIVYCVESKDDEYVTAQRALQGLNAFLALLTGGAKTKQIASDV